MCASVRQVRQTAMFCDSVEDCVCVHVIVPVSLVCLGVCAFAWHVCARMLDSCVMCLFVSLSARVCVRVCLCVSVSVFVCG